ncbi:dolichol kinase [Rhodotorula diobovata]|uniref:dolichol kinase n=1 Tax=Rhodotorula diobovata TaxID=5288 RepID=A0A5C5FYS1_9BASI|nr:dolichol kinase [Rhodotorula diobovata]
MASASGSQTDGADGENESTSSESDADEAVLRARIFGEGFPGFDGAESGSGGSGTGGGGGGGGMAAAIQQQHDARRLSAPPQQWAGERGRGEHVLVKKRSTSPGTVRGTGGAGSAHRERSWGSALLDTLEGHSQNKERRRPVSPSLHPARGGRTVPRNRPSKVMPDPPAAREPSPPLTLDSIRPGWSPFPLYHIRRSLVFEVVILLIPLLFALWRLYSMVPTAVFPSIPAVPLGALLVFALAVPFISLFRREGHYFKAPFTDERGYRDPKYADDGVAAALVLPVLLASAVWWDTYATADDTGRGVGLEGIRSLVDVWEANGIHATSSPRLDRASFDPAVLSAPLERARALFQARYELVLLTALNAACLLLHLALARTLFRIERLPKSNTKRFFGFMGVATTLSAGVWAVFALCNWLVEGGVPIHPLEAAVTTHIQQSSFYLVSRLARRGFTLGELNTMTVAGNALCLEFWRLSWARWNYKRGLPYVPPTFRAPTPVIAFQSVLIPGAFLSGFLLSPLLVVSRHIASRPSHRLKWPTERERHRKLLALGVAVGLCAIVCVPLGGWAGWMLGASPPSFLRRLRRPWGWALRFFAFGDSDGVSDWQQPAALLPPGWSFFSAKRTSRGWRRIALVAYWGTTISSAIGGWQTHLVRKRRIRTRASPAVLLKPSPSHSPTASTFSSTALAPGTTSGAAPETQASATAVAPPGESSARATGSAAAAAAGKRLLGMGMDAMHGAARISAAASAGASGAMRGAAAGRQAAVGRVGAESAREEKAVHASLNMRRKFFHALAVLMFVPGIAVDPAFTSLAFSVAFSLFTFAEYARYFALYPIGGPLHIFFSEFVDSKDGGPVILSHFYLLTGCAGGLWLEGRGINRYTGVLVLGVGDSLASIVGKLVGRTRWPGTTKTLEGTAAFVSSVVLCAWLLRLVGVVEPFSLPRYILGVTLAALLEAASAQNDNLVIPLYLWSVLSLLSV